MEPKQVDDTQPATSFSGATFRQTSVQDLRDLVLQRRSIRRYTNQPIRRDLIEELLTWAIWAPSAHNRQPWRFCVVDDEHSKRDLSSAMALRWASDLKADGVDQSLIKETVTKSKRRLRSAGALIVVSLTMEVMDQLLDRRLQQAEYTMAVQSTALACQNLLLAAHAHGLGACWMCAPLFAPDVVRQSLELPDNWDPQALIALGYPVETRTSERRPLESSVIWR